jgi:hypothetical protein
MQALLLVANTSPTLILTIIRNKLGADVVAVDPKKDTNSRIVFLTDFNKVLIAKRMKQFRKAIVIALCTPFVLEKVKGAIPLDFSTALPVFNTQPHCRFDLLFDIFEKEEKHPIKVSSHSLLSKIVDKRISFNLISLVQSCGYALVPKQKHKALHRALIEWLRIVPAKRPCFDEFLMSQSFKSQPMPKQMSRKFGLWLENDKQMPVAFDKFFKEAKEKANTDIAILAPKYGLNSFDAITLAGWSRL